MTYSETKTHRTKVKAPPSDLIVPLKREEKKYDIAGTEESSLGDLRLLDTLSYLFPSGISRKDFFEIYKSLSEKQKEYFLKALGLPSDVSLDTIDLTFYYGIIQLVDDDASGKIFLDDTDESMISDLDEVVLPRRTEIKIKFDHTKKKPYMVTFTSENPKGFTKIDLVRLIRQAYKSLDSGKGLSLLELIQKDDIIEPIIES